MLTIYGFNTPNVQKVVYTAEKLGAKYEYRHVNLAAGEHKTSEHLGRHFWGKVPAIENDGECLTESNTICRYLARTADSPLYPHHPLAAARVDEMIDMVCFHPGRWLSTYYYEEVIKKRFGGEANQAALDEAKGFLESQLPEIDKRLGGQSFLCGNQISIADTIAIPLFATAYTTSFDLSPWANIQRWLKQSVERPAWQRTMKVVGG